MIPPLNATSPRILMISPRYPSPPLRGDQTRVLFLARALSEFAAVTVLCFGSGPPIEGVRVRTVGRTFASRAGGNLAVPDPGLPVQARLFLDGRMRSAVREELARGVDVAHVALARMGPYMPPPGAAHRHVDLMDSFSINMRTRAEEMTAPASVPFRLESRLLARYEARLAAEADSASLVSRADTAAPGLGDVSVVPNGVDLGEFEFEEPRVRPPELVFFGNLGYFHNIAAAEHAAREVLPLVRDAVPDASLRLVGARPASGVTSLAALPGVTVTGEVPAMAPELRRAAAAVLPLQSGSGIKNKVLEAFAAGTPVVSNALGVQGVEGAEPGVHYLPGETSAELAAAAVRLIEDPPLRVKLAGRALELVSSSYSWRAQALRLLGLYGHPR